MTAKGGFFRRSERLEGPSLSPPVRHDLPSRRDRRHFRSRLADRADQRRDQFHDDDRRHVPRPAVAGGARRGRARLQSLHAAVPVLRRRRRRGGAAGGGQDRRRRARLRRRARVGHQALLSALLLSLPFWVAVLERRRRSSRRSASRRSWPSSPGRYMHGLQWALAPALLYMAARSILSALNRVRPVLIAGLHRRRLQRAVQLRPGVRPFRPAGARRVRLRPRHDAFADPDVRPARAL